MPIALPRPSSSDGDQSRIYGESRQGLRDVPAYSAEVNRALDNLLRKLPDLADGLEEGSKRAGYAIEQSGSRADQALGEAASAHANEIGRQIGTVAAGYIMAALSKVMGANNNPNATGGSRKPSQDVDADLGRSMPPSILGSGGSGGSW